MLSSTTRTTVLRPSVFALLFLLVASSVDATGSFAPRLSSAPAGDFATARREISGGSAWSLAQAWRAAPQEGLLPGTVRFGWTPEALWIYAELTDNHIITRSTGHNQNMCTLGDVFEIFVARRGSPRYLELHVTPNNHRLHLRWTRREFDKVRKKLKTVADFHAAPAAFQSWVCRSPYDSGWQVLACLPAGIFPGGTTFRVGQKFAVSFSRYDAGPEGTPDILSSTSPHRKVDYHRRHEWRTIVLQP